MSETGEQHDGMWEVKERQQKSIDTIEAMFDFFDAQNIDGVTTLRFVYIGDDIEWEAESGTITRVVLVQKDERRSAEQPGYHLVINDDYETREDEYLGGFNTDIHMGTEDEVFTMMSQPYFNEHNPPEFAANHPEAHSTLFEKKPSKKRTLNEVPSAPLIYTKDTYFTDPDELYLTKAEARWLLNLTHEFNTYSLDEVQVLVDEVLAQLTLVDPKYVSGMSEEKE